MAAGVFAATIASSPYDRTTARRRSMTILRLLAEERRRAVVRSYGEEAIVAAKTPAAIWCVPLQSAANVARQEGLRAGDAELRAIVHRQSADASCHVRHNGVM